MQHAGKGAWQTACHAFTMAWHSPGACCSSCVTGNDASAHVALQRHIAVHLTHLEVCHHPVPLCRGDAGEGRKVGEDWQGDHIVNCLRGTGALTGGRQLCELSQRCGPDFGGSCHGERVKATCRHHVNVASACCAMAGSPHRRLRAAMQRYCQQQPDELVPLAAAGMHTCK